MVSENASILHCTKDMWFDEIEDFAKEVILDELRYDSIRYEFLLSLLTWNRGISVPIKGGFKTWYPDTVIITSPEKPENEFSFRNKDSGVTTPRDDIQQLIRRIGLVIHKPIALSEWEYEVPYKGSENNMKPISIDMWKVE